LTISGAADKLGKTNAGRDVVGKARLIVALASLLLLTGCFEGPQGPTGSTGPQGPAGPQGTAGQRGQDGARGELGPVGPQGAAGTQGVKGEQGAKGDRGEQGPKGDRGEQGLPGQQGTAAQANIRLVQENGDTLTCREEEVLASVICGDGAAAAVSQKRSAKCAVANGVVGICMRP
jgi:Collagen triple helix repeat (20 copies)